MLTSQLYFDDAITDEAFTAAPYSDRPRRSTRNDDDNIFDQSGVLTIERQSDGYLGVINLGVRTA